MHDSLHLPARSGTDAHVAALAGIVGARWVSARDTDRAAYARDMWPKVHLWSRAHEVPFPPDLVVWPGTRDEVGAVLRYATGAGLPVVPYGAGSGVCGGTLPVHGGVVVDVKRLDRIELDAERRLAHVGAGVNGEILERTLLHHGLYLGHHPSSLYVSTVGGWIAARGAGQMSSRYGKIEDLVLGLTAVRADGSVVELAPAPVPPGGPGVMQLLVGSEGTLATITSATLRLYPAPAARRLRGLGFDSLQGGLELMRRILRAGLCPAVMRLYDPVDSFIARRTGHDDDAAPPAQRASGRLQKLRTALTRGSAAVALARPELLNSALGQLAACTLVLGFEGEPALVDAELDAALDLAADLDAHDLGAGPGEHWYQNRYAVSYLQSKVFEAGAFADTMEVACTWQRLAGLYEGVRAALAPEVLVMAHFSHAYLDGCSIYFTFMGAAPTPHAGIERYDRAWTAAMGAVRDAGAALSHHHGVGYSKQDFLPGDLGPGGMVLLRRVKQAFDPGGLMNPGKLALGGPPAR